MQDNAHSPESPLFSAIITPHRSLSGAGFAAVMLTFGAASFAAGMIFVTLGAWPVMGFFGLDVALLYLAFHLNYRAALAYEEVCVTPSELVMRKVSRRGEVREWKFNPLWARLQCESHAEYGMQRILLVSHGRQLPIGNCLSPEEKESFAKALAAALSAARRGPTRTPLA